MSRRNCLDRVVVGMGVLVAAVGGCTHESETGASTGAERAPGSAGMASPAASAPETAGAGSATLALREGGASLIHPIHAGVTVGGDEGNAAVSYTRQRGKPFGVAYMLAPNALVGCDAISVAITTQPTLRPQLCLTDSAGNIWNAPLSREQVEGRLRFDLTRVQADPFQNAGKVLPAKADLASTKMLTILDITGFMGGAETACTWTISGIELHRGGVSVGAAESGGAR